MDKTAALKIMALDADASFEDSKKAYRSLAKRFHPDVAGKNRCTEKDAEDRMKEINLAFCYLAPRLNSKNTRKEKNKTGHDRKTVKGNPEKEKTSPPPSFASKLSGLAAAFFKMKKTAGPVKKEGETKKTPGKAGNRKPDFAQVFKRVHQGPCAGGRTPCAPGKKQNLQKTTPYKEYQKYMALKRKFTCGQPGRQREMGIERIEKIEPVRPVDPVA